MTLSRHEGMARIIDQIRDSKLPSNLMQFADRHATSSIIRSLMDHDCNERNFVASNLSADAGGERQLKDWDG